MRFVRRIFLFTMIVWRAWTGPINTHDPAPVVRLRIIDAWRIARATHRLPFLIAVYLAAKAVAGGRNPSPAQPGNGRQRKAH